jgi:hypothetical protein
MSTQTTSAQTVYCFGTVRDQPYASHMLVYMAQKLRGEERGRLDFVSALRLGGSSRWDYEEENDEPYVHSFELGEGVHTVCFEDTQLTVSVTVAASDEIKRVVKFASYSSGASLSKQVTVSGVKSYEQLQRLMRAATVFASALLREESGPNSRVTHSLYIAEGRQFNKLGLLRRRDAQSLFLKEGEIDTLFNLVDGFLKSKDDYERCSVPYKLNLLLYGVPGSGKTTVIKALASRFGLNVAVIPFSPKLTDDSLAHGLTLAGCNGSRIVALEDVDCAFDKRRKPNDNSAASLTLSGLLNCMDGMLRDSSKGLIMILTANTTDCIDKAVLRTARVDYALEFTYADGYQAKSCFKFYADIFGHAFEDQEWDAFWDSISCHRFTTALLQQFFFQARRDRAQFLDAERFKRLVHSAGKEGMGRNAESIYS